MGHTPESSPILSPQETRIARLLATEGAPNKVIAFELGLSEGTVKIYLNRLAKKLRAAGIPVDNRTAIASWAIRAKM